MTSKTRTPNSEQLVAINHLGGKILSAGAGSGKTFVIVEHIVTILERHRKSIDTSEWQQQIPLILPRIVLMTFTKKAAGEMSIRVMNRIDGLCSEINDAQDFWIIVRQYLSLLNITTISAFCHRLISQGFFDEINSNAEIVSRVEYKAKITKLFDAWFASKEENLSEVFQANSSALIEAMINIFTSPELRFLWGAPIVKTSPADELVDFVENIYLNLNLAQCFDTFDSLDLNIDTNEKSKGWFLLLNSFELLFKDQGRLMPDNIKEYVAYAKNAGRLPSAVKSMSDSQKESLDQVKALVTYLRGIEEDLTSFHDFYDVYWSWVETFKNIFDYINTKYVSEKGFDYADLEYFVCKGLRTEDVKLKISKQFDYFIVDEFQDTSSIQFEILNQLVASEKNKLFCVGDRKQAIYGFRGGELKVFFQCSEMLGADNNIWLKNNFRSKTKVINFNNLFFERVFPLGNGFEGRDQHSVAMETQTLPNEQDQHGKVQRIHLKIVNLENEKKINLDFYEAKGLAQSVTELIADKEINSICILYRKLRPSSYLLENLIESGVAYTAQIKIAYGEDPIINLFLRLIETNLNRSNEKKLRSTYFLLNILFDILNIKHSASLAAEAFNNDLEILGLNLAFSKCAFSLGITNSLYQENSQLIASICKVCNDDPARAYQMLSSENTQQYSLEVTRGIKGNEDKRVIIMSAHASKGLEFDAVLLGGIHSNGNQMGKTETVGKMPKSFRWKKAFNQKKFFKSPAYYVEAELDKAKDFSESKRLLYVACTRAINHLGWVELYFIENELETPLGTGTNHWIKALRLAGPDTYENHSLELNMEPFEGKNDFPMILKDSFGLIIKSDATRLGIFAETSVTKLAQLAQCPFKFYLSTICKLSPPETQGHSEHSFLNSEEDNEDDYNKENFYSSKARGTAVHQDLADLLTGKKLIEDSRPDEKDKYEWVMLQTKTYKDHVVISEKLIKFAFFGQMISGTPDIVFDSDANIAVWDFKTGMRKEESEDHYWFQVMCYGYAYANLKHFSPEKKITLSLVYLDQKIIINKEFSSEELSTNLFSKWIKTESLYQVNHAHCFECEYSSICHKKAKAIHESPLGC